MNLNSDPALSSLAGKLSLGIESSPVFPSFSCRETVQGHTTPHAGHTCTLGLEISQLVWKPSRWRTLAKALVSGTMFNASSSAVNPSLFLFFFHYLFIEPGLARRRNSNSTLCVFVIFQFL